MDLTTAERSEQKIVVGIPVDDHQWLQDEAIRRSRAGERTHMTTIVRELVAAARRRALSAA